MNTITIEEQLNKELSIYYYTTSDNTCLEYFIGYQIAALLGYKSPHSFITKNVSKSMCTICLSIQYNCEKEVTTK